MIDTAKLTEDLIAKALTHGNRYNHPEPVWFTRAEAIKAIKHSHDILDTKFSNQTKKTKTENIFELTTPYNSHQGSFRKVLFVCSTGMLRSPTAAAIAIGRGMNARACGTHEQALIRLSVNLISWANQIVFMNDGIYKEAVKTFDKNKEEVLSKTIVWNIDDVYDYMDACLVASIGDYLVQLEKLGVYELPGKVKD